MTASENDRAAGDVTSPVVTIGVPVYNGENYLDEMLWSLRRQTFEDFEVVISDNGSTDATPEIIHRHASADGRFRVYTETENRGAGWNFNRVLDLAAGRYFKWQAHDDLLAPTYLEACVAEFDLDPELVLVYTGVDMVDRDLQLIEHYGIRLDTMNADPVVRFSQQLLTWNLCYDVFGLIDLDVLRRTSGMGNFSHGDGVLLGHLALLGRSKLVDEPLFLSRQHDDQSARRFGYEGGGNDYRAYAEWFDPRRTGSVRAPNWRIVAEYERTIRATPELTWNQRLRCYVVLARRMRWDARLLLGDVAHLTTSSVQSLRERAASGRRGAGS